MKQIDFLDSIGALKADRPPAMTGLLLAVCLVSYLGTWGIDESSRVTI